MKCIIRFLSSSPVLVDIHIKVLIKRRVGSVCMTGDQCVGVWIAGAVEAKVQQSIQIHIRNLRCAIAWQSWEGGLWTFKPVVRYACAFARHLIMPKKLHLNSPFLGEESMQTDRKCKKEHFDTPALGVVALEKE
eukprot:scaffold225031_cov18-Tisochrysis_lutea.AAC.1